MQWSEHETSCMQSMFTSTELYDLHFIIFPQQSYLLFIYYVWFLKIYFIILFIPLPTPEGLCSSLPAGLRAAYNMLKTLLQYQIQQKSQLKFLKASNLVDKVAVACYGCHSIQGPGWEVNTFWISLDCQRYTSYLDGIARHLRQLWELLLLQRCWEFCWVSGSVTKQLGVFRRGSKVLVRTVLGFSFRPTELCNKTWISSRLLVIFPAAEHGRRYCFLSKE